MSIILKEWLPLVILGFNAAMFIVIKFNDMIHMSNSMKELKVSLKEMDKKLDNHSERISCLEGKIKVS